MSNEQQEMSNVNLTALTEIIRNFQARSGDQISIEWDDGYLQGQNDAFDAVVAFLEELQKNNTNVNDQAT